ncbi:MAG: hypothetical protein ACP5HQ_02465 [Thermoprotei archaeon]
MVDFVSLATSLGYDEAMVITAYKAVNGGYFQEIYYAKPPCLARLDKWPKKYASPKVESLLTGNPRFADLISLFITFDLIGLHSMSAIVLSKPINMDQIVRDYEDTRATLLRAFSSPVDLGDLKGIQETKVLELGKELSERRKLILRSDLTVVLNDLAYDSKTFEEAKGEKPWLRGVRRENALKAIALAGLAEAFLKEKSLELKYLAFEITAEFDEFLLGRGLLKTLEAVRNLDSEVAKAKFEEIVRLVKDAGDYF